MWDDEEWSKSISRISRSPDGSEPFWRCVWTTRRRDEFIYYWPRLKRHVTGVPRVARVVYALLAVAQCLRARCSIEPSARVITELWWTQKNPLYKVCGAHSKHGGRLADYAIKRPDWLAGAEGKSDVVLTRSSSSKWRVEGCCWWRWRTWKRK